MSSVMSGFSLLPPVALKWSFLMTWKVMENAEKYRVFWGKFYCPSSELFHKLKQTLEK
jgi:hypothetical protein